MYVFILVDEVVSVPSVTMAVGLTVLLTVDLVGAGTNK